jgi:hypothetical protein
MRPAVTGPALARTDPAESPTELPTAQQLLGVLAAEHSAFRSTFVGRPILYCRACSGGNLNIQWPCRVHAVATQPTRELVALGLIVNERDT